MPCLKIVSVYDSKQVWAAQFDKPTNPKHTKTRANSVFFNTTSLGNSSITA